MSQSLQSNLDDLEKTVMAKFAPSRMLRDDRLRGMRIVWGLFAVCIASMSMPMLPYVWAQQAPAAATPSGRPHLVFDTHHPQILCVAWSPDGATLATGTTFGAIRLWDARSGALLRALDDPSRLSNGMTINTLAFSHDGKLLASGNNYHAINLWNVQSGELVRSLKREGASVAHTDEVYSVAWSPDGKTLASSSADKTVALWDVSTGARLYTLKGHTKDVTGVAFSPDGKTLASVGLEMKLWDAHTGAPKGGDELKGGDPEYPGAGGLAWAPDGATLAIAATPLVLWDVQKQAVQNDGQIPLKPFLGAINSIKFSPDGKFVATAQSSQDPDQPESDVLLWDARTSKLKQTLHGHTKPVADLAFSPDGRRLASVSLDGSVKIWSLSGNRPPVTLIPMEGKRDDWIAMTEEGFYDAPDTEAMNKEAKWRVGGEDVPLETFSATFHRPDIVRRLLQPEPIPPKSEIGLLLAARSAPPAVAFLAPDEKETVKGDAVNMQVEVSDELAVKRLEFRVNGRPVTASYSVGEPQQITDANRKLILGGKAVPTSHAVALRFNASIPLPPGESKILVRAIARDASGLEAVADAHIERELMARGMVLSTLSGEAAREAERLLQGNLHVLSVGVSSYKNPDYNLKYPVADATAFAALWPPMKDRLYQNVLLTQLSDDKVTAASLQAEMNKLVAATTNKDTVLIFLAGHGLRTKDQDFYFATHEASFEHPETTALPWTALADVLAKVPAKRVVLFLDACHSGSALGEARASNERMAEALSRRAGVMVFASSRGDQASLESAAWQHGAFTKAVLEGIADGKADLNVGEGQDGNITVAKLLVYLQDRVPKLTKDQQHPACPLMQDFGEPFRLARLPSAK